MASRAFPQQIRGRPCLPTPAAWAAESSRPTKLKQILPASRLGRKAVLQLQQIARIIFHRRKHYWLWSPESSKYPSPPIISGESWRVTNPRKPLARDRPVNANRTHLARQCHTVGAL